MEVCATMYFFWVGFGHSPLNFLWLADSEIRVSRTSELEALLRPGSRIRTPKIPRFLAVSDQNGTNLGHFLADVPRLDAANGLGTNLCRRCQESVMIRRHILKFANDMPYDISGAAVPLFPESVRSRFRVADRHTGRYKSDIGRDWPSASPYHSVCYVYFKLGILFACELNDLDVCV